MDDVETLEDLIPVIESIEEKISYIKDDIRELIGQVDLAGAEISDFKTALDNRLSAIESKLEQLLKGD